MQANADQSHFMLFSPGSTEQLINEGKSIVRESLIWVSKVYRIWQHSSWPGSNIRSLFETPLKLKCALFSTWFVVIFVLSMLQYSSKYPLPFWMTSYCYGRPIRSRSLEWNMSKSVVITAPADGLALLDAMTSACSHNDDHVPVPYIQDVLLKGQASAVTPPHREKNNCCIRSVFYICGRITRPDMRTILYFANVITYVHACVVICISAHIYRCICMYFCVYIYVSHCHPRLYIIIIIINRRLIALSCFCL